MTTNSDSTASRIRTSYWVPLICAAIVAAGLMWLASVREDMYVRMMDGPFAGLSYAGELPTEPVSELEIESGTRLAVYEVPGLSAPVLVLSMADGERKWSRELKPIKHHADGSKKEAWLRELKLHDIDKTSDGVVVSITCNWELGGREGGRVYLDEELEFREFKLSW